jgi:hypothetical protein
VRKLRAETSEKNFLLFFADSDASQQQNGALEWLANADRRMLFSVFFEDASFRTASVESGHSRKKASRELIAPGASHPDQVDFRSAAPSPMDLIWPAFTQAARR